MSCASQELVALRALQEKHVASTSDVQWVIRLYTLALGVATDGIEASADDRGRVGVHARDASEATQPCNQCRQPEPGSK